MYNEFQNVNNLNKASRSYSDLNKDFFVQNVLIEYLYNKSNDAKVKNKYFSSLNALKAFVQPN